MPPRALSFLEQLTEVVRPVYLVGIMVASVVWGASRVDARIERVEHSIAVLTSLACAERPSDSLCRDSR